MSQIKAAVSITKEVKRSASLALTMLHDPFIRKHPAMSPSFQSKAKQSKAKQSKAKQSKALASGFTLIELIVVIVILGVLAATAMPKYLNMRREARIAALAGLEGSLRTAVQESQTLYFAAPERITFSDPTVMSGHLQINNQTRIQVLALPRVDPMTPERWNIMRKVLGVPINNYAGIGKFMGMSPEIKQLPKIKSSPTSMWYGMAQGFMVAGLLDPNLYGLEEPLETSALGSFWFPPGIKPEDVTGVEVYDLVMPRTLNQLTVSYEFPDPGISPRCYVYYKPTVSPGWQEHPAYRLFSRTSEC